MATVAGQDDLVAALDTPFNDPAVESKFNALKKLQFLKVKSLMTSLDAMKKENEKLKEQMDQMQQDYENRLQDAKTEVEELLKQCDEFQLQIGVFTVEIQAKDEKINEWETAYEKLEGVNKANEFKIQDL